MRFFRGQWGTKTTMLFYIVSDHCEILRVIGHNRLVPSMMIWIMARTSLGTTAVG